MVAQANTGTPGHINSLAIAGRAPRPHLRQQSQARRHRHTNDPWMSAGHFFDITVLTPIFDGDRILAYIGSTIHHTDIGGYGIGAGARDVHEEGLWIPPLKLYNAGEPCPMLHAIISERAHARRRVRRSRRAGVERPGRQRAADRAVPALRAASTSRSCPTRSSTARRPRPARRSASSRPARCTARARSTCRAAQVITLKSAVTIDPTPARYWSTSTAARRRRPTAASTW